MTDNGLKVRNENDFIALLSQAGDSYVEAYHKLVAIEDRKAVVSQIKHGNNIEVRKSAWRNAVKAKDHDVLRVIKEKLMKFVPMVNRNAKIVLAEPHILTPDEAESVLTQYVVSQEATEFIKATQEEVKKLVFAAMDVAAEEEGAEFPEHTNRTIDVPALGKRFSREGTGRKDPVMDEDKLRKLVGEEVWNKITIEEIIPAQTRRNLDIDLMMKHAAVNTPVMEHIRESLIVGEWKTPRLNVRPIPAPKES